MGVSQEPPSPISCLSPPPQPYTALMRLLRVGEDNTHCWAPRLKSAPAGDPKPGTLGTFKWSESLPPFTNGLKKSEEPLRCPSPLFWFKMVSVPESCPGEQLLRANVYQEPSSGSHRPSTTWSGGLTPSSPASALREGRQPRDPQGRRNSNSSPMPATCSLCSTDIDQLTDSQSKRVHGAPGLPHSLRHRGIR